MAGLNQTISIILNVNRLNNPTKSWRLSHCIFKNCTICCLQETHFSFDESKKIHSDTLCKQQPQKNQTKQTLKAKQQQQRRAERINKQFKNYNERFLYPISILDRTTRKKINREIED